MQNGMSYPYGQLPPQGYGQAAPTNPQHPVPGSYTNARSLFNPQTRSFVPSSNSGRNNARGNRKRGTQTPNSSRSGATSGAMSPAPVQPQSGLSPKLKEDSLQQKYGTPANLPKKPPPSQNPPHYAGDHSSSSAQTSANAVTAAKVVANGDID